MRSVSQGRNRDAKSCIGAGVLAERNGIAIRTDETDRERRDRLVESEPQHRGPLRDHGAVGRFSLHQRGMSPRNGRRQKQSERQRANGDDGRKAPAHAWLPIRQQLQAGRRFSIVACAFAFGGNLNPAVHAPFALLHDREI